MYREFRKKLRKVEPWSYPSQSPIYIGNNVENSNKTPAEERDIFRPELFYNYINEAQE